MEKEKRKNKPSTKKPVLKITVFFMLIAIVACLYPIIPRYNMTPFFKHVKTTEEAHSLLLEHLEVGVSTRDDVRILVTEALRKDAKQMLIMGIVEITRCHPDFCNLPYNSVFGTKSWWQIRFTYNDDNILTDIEVEIRYWHKFRVEGGEA